MTYIVWVLIWCSLQATLLMIAAIILLWMVRHGAPRLRVWKNITKPSRAVAA